MDIKNVKTACYLLCLLTLLTGFIYPMLITGLAQLFFPWQANGSLMELNGITIGSKWIGQSFTSPEFFHGRPSATTPFPYNAKNSTGSNMALTNPAFIKHMQDAIQQVQALNPNQNQLIPMDMITASASGLDPDISLNNAYYQIPRVAKARLLSVETLTTLVNQQLIHRSLGFIGDERVNVLALNLALLSLSPPSDINHD